MNREPSSRLLGARLVVFVLLAVLALLAALFPRRLRELALSEESAVTLAYRRSLLASSPEDKTLALSLAMDESLDDGALARLVTDDDEAVAPEALARLLDRWRGTGAGTVQRMTTNRLLVCLLSSDREALTSTALSRPLAHAALDLGRPDLAAAWWLRAAEGRDGHAADALAAVEALLATNGAFDARAVAERLTALFTHDHLVRRAADALVLARARPTDAAAWWQRRLDGSPDDVGALARLRDALLESGDAASAMEPAERLAAIVPSQARQAARIAGWTHRFDRAQHWWTQLGLAGDLDALSEAMRLALERSDTEETLRLGLALAEGRTLTNAQMDGLAAAATTSHDASRTLAFLATRPDATRAVLVRRVQTLDGSGDLDEALRTLRELSERFGRSPEGNLSEASLLQRLGRPLEALALLRAMPTTETESRLRLLADVAFEAGDDDAARDGYASLRKRGWLKPGEDDRLVELVARTDVAAGLALAVSLWETSQAPKDLLRAVSTALRSHHRDRARLLMDAAEAKALAPLDTAAWWQMKGEVDVQDGRLADALAHFDEAWSREPTPSLQSRMIWLALTTDDRPSLARLLDREPRAATSDLLGWFARGHERLGHPVALSFYARAAAERPDDTLLMNDYAHALHRAGRSQDAHDVRRALFERLHARAASATSGLDEGTSRLHAQLAQAFLPPDEAQRWRRSDSGTTLTRERTSSDSQEPGRSPIRYTATFDTLQSPDAGLMWREGGAMVDMGSVRLSGRGGRLEMSGRSQDTALVGVDLSRGGTTLSAAVDARGSDLLAQGVARQFTNVRGPLAMEGALAWNETRSLPWGLRAGAARNRASIAARWDAAPLTAFASLDAHRYTTRAGTGLADGLSSEAAVEHALSPRVPEARLRLSAMTTTNVDASGGSRPPELAAWLPDRFTTVGLGLGWDGGALDDSTRRLRAVAEAWAGAVLPAGRIAVRGRAGAGLRIVPGLDLVVDAFAADDQPLAGAGAVVGLDVRLTAAR